MSFAGGVISKLIVTVIGLKSDLKDTSVQYGRVFL